MATCRSCRAPIFWAVTLKKNGDVGKRMPVDLEPNPEGNVEVVDQTRLPDERDWTPVVRVLAKGEGDTLPGIDPPERFMPHHATCPDAAQWKRS